MVTSIPQGTSEQQKFFDAIDRGNLAGVADALRHGADPNHVMPDGEYPLHRAVQKGEEFIVCYLLHQRASPLVQNGQNKTAYDLAIEQCVHRDVESNTSEKRKWLAIREYLAVRPYHTDPKNQRIQQLFFDAILQGTVAEVEREIIEGASVNTESVAGDRPLHLAVSRPDVVDCLLRWGANPLRTNVEDLTAQQVAEKNDLPDMQSLLARAEVKRRIEDQHYGLCVLM